MGLPDLLVFVRGTVPADSSALGSERGIASIRDSEFAMWGTHVVELPHSLQPTFCKLLWPLVLRAKLTRKQCPERVVTMANSVFVASKKRIEATPRDVWADLLKLLEDQTSPSNEQLVDFAWHLLLGEKAVLQSRLMSQH